MYSLFIIIKILKFFEYVIILTTIISFKYNKNKKIGLKIKLKVGLKIRLKVKLELNQKLD